MLHSLVIHRPCPPPVTEQVSPNWCPKDTTAFIHGTALDLCQHWFPGPRPFESCLPNPQLLIWSLGRTVIMAGLVSSTLESKRHDHFYPCWETIGGWRPRTFLSPCVPSLNPAGRGKPFWESITGFFSLSWLRRASLKISCWIQLLDSTIPALLWCVCHKKTGSLFFWKLLNFLKYVGCYLRGSHGLIAWRARRRTSEGLKGLKISSCHASKRSPPPCPPRCRQTESI